MFFRIIVITAALCAFTWAEPPATNRDLANRSILAVVDSLSEAIADPDSGIALRFGSVRGEKRGFLNQLLIGYFRDRNVPVNRPDAAYILNIEQFQAAIVYKQERKTLLGLSDTYERTFSLTLEGWMGESGGEVLHVISRDTILRDRISESEIENIEADPYAFLQGRKIETSAWAKAIEPALVILSVSTVVYLFFTMRS